MFSNIVFDFNRTCYSCEIFPSDILLLTVHSFEGFSNWSKSDGMVNNHLSSFNLHQLSFELQQHLGSHYEENSIKLTTFGFMYVSSKKEVKSQPKHPWCKKSSGQ